MKLLGCMVGYMEGEVILDTLCSSYINLVNKNNTDSYDSIEGNNYIIINDGDKILDLDFNNYIEMEFDIDDLDINSGKIDYDKVKIAKRYLPKIKGNVVNFKEVKDNSVIYTLDNKFKTSIDTEYGSIEIRFNNSDIDTLKNYNIIKYADRDLNIVNNILILNEEDCVMI